MAKYHVNAKGEPGPCKARKHCPFGDIETDHFSTAEEARSAFEASMKHATFAATKTPNTLATDDLLRMNEEDQRRTMGAVWRVLKSGLMEGQAKKYWQAAYDASPAGALWLERKRQDGLRANFTNPEYVERKYHLDKFLEEQETNPMELELPEDPGHVFESEFSTPEPMAFPDKEDMSDEKVKLALISAAWMTNLTPEETEAVSWMTGNGSTVLNTHINGEEHYMWGHKVYSKDFLNKTLKNFRSAMAKAPELDEPIIIYRGTSEDRADWSELTRPASSSVAGDTAKGFRGNKDDGTFNEKHEPVILEIKTRKVPAVAGMSVYGMGEMEVLAPLGHYRKVGEFRTLRGSERQRMGNTPAIDPQFDSIKVIQLEYVGEHE